MNASRLFLWTVAAAALVISAILVWQRMPAGPMAAVVKDQPLADGEAYCCTEASTCAVMKKDDCSSFFTLDAESCASRCGSAR